jgi:hypothetical protein
MLIILTNVIIYGQIANGFPVKKPKIPVNDLDSDAKKDERLQSRLE